MKTSSQHIAPTNHDSTGTIFCALVPLKVASASKGLSHMIPIAQLDCIVTLLCILYGICMLFHQMIESIDIQYNTNHYQQ